MPRGGGIAVAAAFTLVAVAFLVANVATDAVALPRFLKREQVVALLLGGAGAALLGAIDDLLDLRARWQLVGQVALGVFAVALGITIDFIANPFTRPLSTSPSTACSRSASPSSGSSA